MGHVARVAATGPQRRRLRAPRGRDSLPPPHRLTPVLLGVENVISELSGGGALSRRHRDDQPTLVAVQPSVTVDGSRGATGWDLQVSDQVAELASPTDDDPE